MQLDPTELTAVLAEELDIGEALSRNLENQRQALVTWDIPVLLNKIEAREHWLRQLAALEQRRAAVLKELQPVGTLPTLSELMAKMLPSQPGYDRCRELQEHGRSLFSRLRVEESDLKQLMENLASHIEEALGRFARPEVPLYRETGSADAHRPSAALLHRQA